jgi:ABC-type nickel/cobalt efflux system permease component RcnA
MLGLDDKIAASSDGASLWIVLAIAILLGLRHATDPDHLAAVTTLIAGSRERAGRSAGALGLAWGLGHAVTVFAFGLPILLLDEYLPERVQQGAETAIAAVIVYLAARLLLRWRRGYLHVHAHEHGGHAHAHVHMHVHGTPDHAHPHRARSRLGAFAIGLAHGVGGSAGVGVLLVASVESTVLAVASLALLAVFTAISMAILSTGFGVTLVSRPVRMAFNGLAPALGVASLAFGVWYAGAAWSLAPYPF